MYKVESRGWKEAFGNKKLHCRASLVKIMMPQLNKARCLIVLIAILLRWSVALHPYSGYNKPPMFGDYEAQRHWMEITINLPLKDWYFNTTENDLMYWGLDYPPLTAYHSYICGFFAHLIDPNFVALGASHGYESYGHKLFMRATVLLADILVYIPAVWWYCSRKIHRDLDRTCEDSDVQHSEKDSFSCTSVLYFVLIYPGLILIDHGHFQYNGISLGLLVAAITALLSGGNVLASALFCLSLNYKQMELYHALPFFCYLLGMCYQKSKSSFKEGTVQLVSISCVVVVMFLVIWFPFLTNVNLAFQVLHRLFPLARGVFEDKVSNVWCSLNVVYKLRNSFNNNQMAVICFASTILAVLPSALDLFVHPKSQKFLVALINSSLAFFLFSFQVHEKSILLVAIPVALYMVEDPLPCFWFLILTTFSMLPLLLKDGLLLAYIALTLLYMISMLLIVKFDFHMPVERSNLTSRLKTDQLHKTKKEVISEAYGDKVTFILELNTCLNLLFLASLVGCAVLTICSATVQPPSRYPDLFPLLISVYSCIHFCAFFAYFNYRQIFGNVKLKSK